MSAMGGNTQSLLGALLKSGAEEVDLGEAEGTVESGLKSLGRKLFGK